MSDNISVQKYINIEIKFCCLKTREKLFNYPSEVTAFTINIR